MIEIGLVATKAQVGLENVDNTADSAKPVSTAQQTALNGKANSAHAHGVADLTATGTKDGTTYLRGDNVWATPPGGGGGSVSDASTSSKGIVQLAGDLGGTAAAPVIVRRGPLGGNVGLSSATSIAIDASQGNNFYVNATTNVAFTTPTGGVDGQQLMIEVYASGGSRNISVTGTTTFLTGISTSTIALASGKIVYISMRYSARGSHWVVIAMNYEA